MSSTSIPTGRPVAAVDDVDAGVRDRADARAHGAQRALGDRELIRPRGPRRDDLALPQTEDRADVGLEHALLAHGVAEAAAEEDERGLPLAVDRRQIGLHERGLARPMQVRDMLAGGLDAARHEASGADPPLATAGLTT